MLVADLCGAGQAGDETVIPNADGTRGGVILRMRVEHVADVAGTELDQGCTALRALLVEVDEIVTNMVVVGLLDGHRQHDEAVAQLHIADLERLVK